MTRMRTLGAVGLAVVLLAGCATGRSMRRAQAAELRNDWDAAVGYYREALGREPSRVDLQIGLARASRQAARVRFDRALALEQQNQLAAAATEYRAAANLDPGATVYIARAQAVERRMREAEAAARPQSPIEQAQQRAAAQSPIPQLDPRTLVPKLAFPNATVRDILGSISKLTGITIAYDQTDPTLSQLLGRAYTIDVVDTPLQDVLNNVLSMNGLAYKINSSTSIFVYQDNQQKRQQFEELYVQHFPLSYSDSQEIQTLLQQLIVTGSQNRARVIPSKTRNTVTLQAPAQMLALAQKLIRAHDKPTAEVLIQAEILEVNRAFLRSIGLDLSQWALGFTYSPVEAPPATAGVPDAFPEMPPPFGLNALSGEPRVGSWFMSSPTALIRFLETNSDTKVWARPHITGTHGAQMTLRLGSEIPTPSTTFQSSGTGGIANVPTTSFTYRPVGINLTFTPRITLEGDVILENLTVEKSDLGLPITIAGQSLPTFDTRNATSSLRLRDGQPSMLAGLFRNEDRNDGRSIPGLSTIPGLRNIFGNTESNSTQTEIVMFITPHIIRTAELTAEDLTPIPVGTAQNIGGSGNPPLISLESVGGAPGPGAATATVAPAPATAEVAPIQAQAPATAVGVVPIQAVGAPGAAPPPPAGPARVTLVAPSPGPTGALQAGGGPHAVPIQISGVSDLGTVSLTIAYDPAVLTTPAVTQGSFMMQGGVAATFVPKVDTAAGRIDLVISRPSGQAGASGTGVLGAVTFVAGSAGTSEITVTGVATSTSGRSIPLQFSPARVVVK